MAHEQTINIALGEVLQPMGIEWKVRAEEIGGTFEDGGRPDILIEKIGGWPIVVEAEVGNHRQAEIEACSRLRKRLTNTTSTVDTAVALVYPKALRNFHGERLRGRSAKRYLNMPSTQPYLRVKRNGFRLKVS